MVLGRGYDPALELSRLEFARRRVLDPRSAEFLLRGAGMEGLALSGMGRYEEALAAVESAIAIAISMGRPANVVKNYSTGPLRDIFAAGGGARPQLGGRRTRWARRTSTCRGSTRAPT